MLERFKMADEKTKINAWMWLAGVQNMMDTIWYISKWHLLWLSCCSIFPYSCNCCTYVIFFTKLISEWILENMWILTGWSLNDVWMMSEWGLDAAWMMSKLCFIFMLRRRCDLWIFILLGDEMCKLLKIWPWLWNDCFMSLWCLNDVWMMSGWCLN